MSTPHLTGIYKLALTVSYIILVTTNSEHASASVHFIFGCNVTFNANQTLWLGTTELCMLLSGCFDLVTCRDGGGGGYKL